MSRARFAQTSAGRRPATGQRLRAGLGREAQLYPPLKQHFKRQGYQVYAEVPAPHGGYIDLLAVRGERSVAVEMKLSFSRLALRQAARNRQFVWQSFVAVPGANTSAGRSLRRTGAPRRPAGAGAGFAPAVAARGASLDVAGQRPSAGLAVEMVRRLRRALSRRRVGLLLVSGGEVTCALASPQAAPAFTVRQAFGSHLEGAVAQLYASAGGGVPTAERVSAYRSLLAGVEGALRARGGVAATEQILEDTLPWNYFRAKRAGLRALLEEHFRELAPGLWSTPERISPAVHAVRMDRVVRAHDQSLRVVLEDAGSQPLLDPLPQTGDILWFVENSLIRARSLLKFAGRYVVKETPQRELRAGPAIFFPWRLGGAVPRQVIVAGLAGYRDLKVPKRFPRELPLGWQTLRPRSRRHPARREL